MAERRLKYMTGQTRELAVAALYALARYNASGLVHHGERMHEDLAERCTRAADSGKW